MTFQDFKKYLLSFLVSFVAMLLFLELVWIPAREHLPRELLLLGFVGAPNQMVDDTRLNAMGFTGDDVRHEKEPNAVRILTVGGSAIFNRRMTERIKAGIQSVSEKPVEVLGAALRSHTSRSSLLKLETLKKYDFDYLIIYENINDLWANHFSPEEYREDYSSLGAWYHRNIILDHSLIARKVYNFFYDRKHGGNVSYVFPDQSHENLSHFASEKTLRNNLELMIELAKKNGIKPILVTFANSIPDNYSRASFDGHSLGYNNPTNYDAVPVELWGSPAYVREGLDRNNKMIRDLAGQLGVPLIDQEALIGKDLKWFGDVCHLSEEGTDRFVENITSFFSKMLNSQH